MDASKNNAAPIARRDRGKLALTCGKNPEKGWRCAELDGELIVDEDRPITTMKYDELVHIYSSGTIYL